MKSAQKFHSSTQKFTEIKDIVENVVLLTSGNACLIIEIEATNFSLLSAEEQNVKIFSYASLLNALPFPIQIVIRNKRIDISSYLLLLEEESAKTENKKLSEQITLYRNFVQELIKINSVLDKKFYLVLSYSYLEKGVSKGGREFANQAIQALRVKADSLNNQFTRLNLKAKVLTRDELVELFYGIYNSEEGQPEFENIKSPIVGTIAKT